MKNNCHIPFRWLFQPFKGKNIPQFSLLSDVNVTSTTDGDKHILIKFQNTFKYHLLVTLNAWIIQKSKKV